MTSTTTPGCAPGVFCHCVDTLRIRSRVGCRRGLTATLLPLDEARRNAPFRVLSCAQKKTDQTITCSALGGDQSLSVREWRRARRTDPAWGPTTDLGGSLTHRRIVLGLDAIAGMMAIPRPGGDALPPPGLFMRWRGSRLGPSFFFFGRAPGRKRVLGFYVAPSVVVGVASLRVGGFRACPSGPIVFRASRSRFFAPDHSVA
jgi:hypothetical protein